MPATRQCDARFVAEVRDLEPTADGWRQCEPSGRAAIICACGLNSGWIPRGQAAALAADHRPTGHHD